MGLAFPIAPSRRLIRVLDVLLVLWAATWIALGVLIGVHVRGLRTLSDTVAGAGRTFQEAGRQLRALEGLPFVGERLSRVGGELDRGARTAFRSARESREDLETLSVLLGVGVAAAPTVPLVALYVPLRWSRAKEVRAVRRGLRSAVGDPLFAEFLARRAVHHLPYHVLREMSANPWLDIEQGRHALLARAELRRLGIQARFAIAEDPPAGDHGAGPRRRLPSGSAG